MQHRVVGEGPPLVYLRPGGGIDAAEVIAGLAVAHRVIVPSELPADAAELIVNVAGEPCDVVGSGAGAVVAARLTIARPELVQHLVLAGPPFTVPADDEVLAALAAIERLVLVLQGTRSGFPPAAVQELRRRARSAFLVYVWDAGDALEADQPARVLALIDGFLKRSESFIVNWGTLAVNP
jgi:pimeloyl-ACP methyl ester carboxylesterase